MTTAECIQMMIEENPGMDRDEARGECMDLMSEEAKLRTATQRFLDPNSGKFYIRAFLLDPTINLNQWAVTRDSIDRNIHTFVGKPLVITEKFDHPMPEHIDSMDHWLAYQESYRVGNIVDIVKRLNPRTGSYGYHAVIEVTNKDLENGIRSNRVPLYVSPALAQKVAAGLDLEKAPEVFSEWSGMHLAIVDEPAFGIRKAIISDTCAGDSDQCLLVLRKAHVEKHGAGNCGFCIKKALASLTSLDKNSGSKSRDKSILSNQDISKIENISDSGPKQTEVTKSVEQKAQSTQTPTQSLQSYKGDNELLAENDRLKMQLEQAQMKIQELQTAKDTNSERIAALELQQRRKDIEHIITAEVIKDDKERIENVEWYTASSIPVDQIARHFNQMKMVIRKASKDMRGITPRVAYLSASSMGTGSGSVASSGGTNDTNSQVDEDGLTPLQKQLKVLRGGL